MKLGPCTLTSQVVIHLLESYDIKIEDGLKFPIADRDLPGVEEQTICFWLKLVDNWKAPSGSGVRLIHATMAAEDWRTTGQINNEFYLIGTADSISLQYTRLGLRVT